MVSAGGAGGNGTEWQASPAYGAGGGGGGGGDAGRAGFAGGNGGSYGAGGGSGGSYLLSGTGGAGGNGKQGLIVITYAPALSPIINTLTAQCTVPTNATSSVTVTCAQATSYSCTDSETISQTSTSTDCTVTNNSNYAFCTAPGFCNKGGSTCYYAAPDFIPTSNQSLSLSGNLTLHPTLIPKGGKIKVYWNVLPDSAKSCTVIGSNGDGTAAVTDTVPPGIWNTYTGSETSSPIQQQTTYTLSCLQDDNVTYKTETQTVNVAPSYQER
jgi:hypothetical protein